VNIKLINQNTRKAFFVSVLALLILVPICFELAYRQKIYPGISVAQTSIGNHTRQEAQKTAQKIIGEKRPKNIQLLWNNQSWEVNLEELNLVYQLPKTINRAYNLGRNQNPIANLKIRYQIWRNQEDLNFDYILNSLQLEKQISVLADLVFVPNVSPSIGLDPKTQKVTIDPGSEGQKLEKEKLLRQINLEELNLVYQLPKTINRAYNLGRSQNLITNLKIRYQIWKNQENLDFDYTLGYLQLEKQITVLADLVFVPNISPSINLDPETQKITIDPGSEGQKLEKEKLLRQVNSQIGNLNNTSISLPVKKPIF